MVAVRLVFMSKIACVVTMAFFEFEGICSNPCVGFCSLLVDRCAIIIQWCVGNCAFVHHFVDCALTWKRALYWVPAVASVSNLVFLGFEDFPVVLI